MDSLAQPILSCLDTLTTEVDRQCSENAEENDAIDPLLIRLSHEIRLLATIVECFFQEVDSKNILLPKEHRHSMITCYRNPVVSLLHTCWPGLTHIAKNYGSFDVSK